MSISTAFKRGARVPRVNTAKAKARAQAAGQKTGHALARTAYGVFPAGIVLATAVSFMTKERWATYQTAPTLILVAALVVAFGALVAFFTFVRGLSQNETKGSVGTAKGNAALVVAAGLAFCAYWVYQQASAPIWWQQELLARVIIGVGTIAGWTWGVAAFNRLQSVKAANQVVDEEESCSPPWQQPESLESELFESR